MVSTLKLTTDATQPNRMICVLIIHILSRYLHYDDAAKLLAGCKRVSSTSTGQPGLRSGRHGAERQRCYRAADEIFKCRAALTADTAPMIRAMDGGQLNPTATLVHLQRTDGAE